MCVCVCVCVCDTLVSWVSHSQWVPMTSRGRRGGEELERQSEGVRMGKSVTHRQAVSVCGRGESESLIMFHANYILYYIIVFLSLPG